MFKEKSLDKLLYKISVSFVNAAPEDINAVIYSSIAELGEFFGHKAYFYFYSEEEYLELDSFVWQKSCTKESCMNAKERYLELFEDKLRKDIPVTTSDLHMLEESKKTDYERDCIKSLLLLPVFLKSSLFGVLGFENFSQPRSFTQNEIFLLESFGQLLISVCQRKKKGDELKRKNEELDRFFSVNLDLLCICDFEGRFVRVNKEWEKTLGFAINDITGSNYNDFVHEDDRKSSGELLDSLKEGAPIINFVNRYRTKDGSYRHLEWRANVYGNYLYGAARDITQHLITEKMLEHDKEHFRTILLSVGDGVIATDNSGKIIMINRVAEQLTGWSYREAKGLSVQKVYTVYDAVSGKVFENIFTNALADGKRIEPQSDVILRSKFGIDRPIDHTVSPVLDKSGNILGAVAVFRDFTEKKNEKDKIIYLSYNDQLTGLYNRRFFEETLIACDKPENLPISICMIDVNGLKLTNDAFGHIAGDKLLTSISMILKDKCRDEDIISRIGGDEFVVVLKKTDRKTAAQIIKTAYDEIINTKVNNINMSVSYGVETKTLMGHSLQDTLIKAENYMYSLKLSQSQSVRSSTVSVILKTIFEKSPREELHSKNVSMLCEKAAIALNLPPDEVHDLKLAGLMHDIGIIILPDSITEKQDTLTDEDWRQIKRHSETGYNILSSVNEFAGLSKIVLQHHERVDGTGYPEKLTAENIDLKAKILAVADVYEAMTNTRPYRKAPLTADEAAKELLRCSGTQFDAEIVDIFIHKVI